MKKAKAILYVLLCVVLSVASVFVTLGILKGCEKSDEIDEREADFEEKGENEKKTNYDKENKDSGKGEKTRLTKDGVDYLVTDGKLIISGDGTVTREAVSELSPKFNIIDFESGNLNVGDDAFNGYVNVIEITLRNSVSSIGERAFAGCSVPLVVFGNSITDIGEDAFRDCCIDYVFINNDYIFRNFDSRYDFGGVAEKATNVYVYKDIVPFDASGDYSGYNSVAGDYLTKEGVFDKLSDGMAGTTIPTKRYRYDGYFHKTDCYFCALIGAWAMVVADDYDAERNVMKYDIDKDYWKNRGIDIELYTAEHLDGVTYQNVPTKSTTDDNNDTDSNTSVSSGSNFVDNRTSTNKNRGQNCHTCNGSGKKTCTSCNGQGYTYKYDNYAVFGDGKLTKIKKTCMVCHGTGRVTCYH